MGPDPRGLSGSPRWASTASGFRPPTTSSREGKQPGESKPGAAKPTPNVPASATSSLQNTAADSASVAAATFATRQGGEVPLGQGKASANTASSRSGSTSKRENGSRSAHRAGVVMRTSEGKPSRTSLAFVASQVGSGLTVPTGVRQ